MNAIDTNILAYSLDGFDAAKRLVALRLLESLPDDQTLIPWQVACEIGAVIKTMTQKGKFSGDYFAAVGALRSRFPVVLPTRAVLDRATVLQKDHQISYWDSLLIAACAEAGVTRLYTEDLQGQPGIHGVQIINPFT